MLLGASKVWTSPFTNDRTCALPVESRIDFSPSFLSSLFLNLMQVPIPCDGNPSLLHHLPPSCRLPHSRNPSSSLRRRVRRLHLWQTRLQLLHHPSIRKPDAAPRCRHLQHRQRRARLPSAVFWRQRRIHHQSMATQNSLYPRSGQIVCMLRPNRAAQPFL